jgi:hypothetical protein
MADILAVIDADIGQAIQVNMYTSLGEAWPAPDGSLPDRVRKKKSRVAASEILHQHVRS